MGTPRRCVPTVAATCLRPAPCDPCRSYQLGDTCLQYVRISEAHTAFQSQPTSQLCCKWQAEESVRQQHSFFLSVWMGSISQIYTLTHQAWGKQKSTRSIQPAIIGQNHWGNGSWSTMFALEKMVCIWCRNDIFGFVHFLRKLSC